MMSQAVDYDALEASTSIEEITENMRNQNILQSLKHDYLPALWLCAPALAEDDEDYVLGGSTELGWLGHFVKKSTHLESFGVHGLNIFDNCSGESVDRFFEELGRCSHIKKMNFVNANLAEIVYKLGPAMKNSTIIHWSSLECFVGVPEATFLFDTFRDMKSLGDLCIDGCGAIQNDLNDDAMAGCIPSLAACVCMKILALTNLNMSNNSCAALSGVFPRMATLLELSLHRNSIDDDSARALAQGVSECKRLQSLTLSHNRISDNGLDALIEGLPASVDTLNLQWNEVTLARQLPLLRFKKLDLRGNSLSLDGPRVVAASLANPECRLEELNLNYTNIRDEGATVLASSLRSNKRLIRMPLTESNITDSGWNAFSTILCNTTTINDTHASNHTLQSLGYKVNMPRGVVKMLELNSDQDKSRIAATKILLAHHHLDMRPLFGWEFGLLPYVIAWLERFTESRLDLQLSSIFEFVRAMPMKVTDRVVGRTTGKKRKLSC